MSYLEVRDLSKNFDAFNALKGVSLSIEQGEFVGLLGPSGCGKTTLLRLLAGLEMPSQGSIVLDGKDISSLQARERPFHMVFQNYALFPHLSVRENIAFPLKIANWSSGDIEKRISELLDLVRLRGFEKRTIDSLSGGQSQRVALARALASRPKVLLLDEPLSALDPQLRDDVRAELKELHAKLKTTFVLVTHDCDEAFELCSRIFVMNAGKIVQSGSAEKLYAYPETHFVADFLGEMICLPLSTQGNEQSVLGQRLNSQIRRIDPNPDSFVFRPEDIELDKKNSEALGFEGKIIDLAFRGSHRRLLIKLSNYEKAVLAFDPHLERERKIGDSLSLTINLKRAFLANSQGFATEL